MATRQEIEQKIRNVDKRIEINRRLKREAEECRVWDEARGYDSSYEAFCTERAQLVEQLKYA